MIKYNDYIKESLEEDYEKLKKQTDLYLAYLKDEGFIVVPEINTYRNINLLVIFKENFNFRGDSNKWGDDSFSWDEISDYLMPYLNILNDEYDIKISLTEINNSRRGRELTLKEIYKLVDSDKLLKNQKTLQIIEIYLYPKKEFKLNKLQKFGNYIKNKFK